MNLALTIQNANPAPLPAINAPPRNVTLRTDGEEPMQLWLTFEELGELLNCDPDSARKHVYANQWERRRCSDGITRTVLPPESAREFMLAFAARQIEPTDRPPMGRPHVPMQEATAEAVENPANPLPPRTTRTRSRREELPFVPAALLVPPWAILRPSLPVATPA
jgi:hypothetical protein